MTLRALRVILAFALACLALPVCLVVACLVVAPSEAMAQPAEADKHIKEGDRLAGKNEWAPALAEFQKAHELSPSAGSQKRVANALYKLDRTVEAYDAYDALIKSYGTKLMPPDKKTAEERRAELKGKIGTLIVRASETGSSVAIDGIDAGTTPMTKPVRVKAGPHTVRVAKQGFRSFEASVDVAGKTDAAVDAKLEELTTSGTLKVTVKGGEELDVVVDGQVMGKTPWEGKLAAGPHKVAGRSATLSAAEVSVDVKVDETATVQLEAGRGQGTLEVDVENVQGDIFVDGEKVGTGNWKGQLSEGEHTLRVALKGYQPVEKKVQISAGEVRAETISLRKAAAGEVKEEIVAPWSFNGLYGGLQLIGMFEPTGAGNTMDDSCEVTGATSCEGGVPMGGALSGYIGYAFAPVGLELQIVGNGDVVEPNASFNGTNTQNINPLVAEPAREEDFLVARFGGGGAIRLRLLFPIGRFRITGAIGAGMAYHQMILKRDTVAANGAESAVTPDGVGYLSGVLSVELGAQVLLGGTTSLELAFNMWLEHAGDGVATEPDNGVRLVKDGEVPRPQATPAYDLATGTQLYIGPLLGLHFGP